MSQHNPPPGAKPPVADDEAATLLFFLERQRATFAWKTGGLNGPDLHVTLAPTTMTLGGMLKHLTRFEDDMSTEWLLGQTQRPPWNSIDWESDHAWDWHSAINDSPEELYARWDDAVARSRERFAKALVAGDLGQPNGVITGTPGQLPSLRYVLLNMIEEYARHNGHADLIRESIDGLAGQDPPD